MPLGKISLALKLFAMTNRFYFLIIIVVFFLINFSTIVNADDKIPIGVSLPLSGDAAGYGTDIKNGIIFAAEKLGAGRYQLIIEDDQCSEKGAVTVAHKFVTLDKVKAVVGFGCSGAVLGSAPVYEKAKVLVIASSTGAPAITAAGDYIFRTIPSLTVAAEKLAEHVALSHKNIGIISEETAYGLGLKEAFLKSAAPKKVNVITEDFLPNTSDFRTQLIKLRGKGITALFVNSQSEAGLVMIVRQLKDLKWNPALYGVYYPGSPAYLEAFGSSGDGIVYADLPFNEQMLNQQGLKDYQEFLQKYGPPKSGEFNIILAYISFSVLDQAIRAKATDLKDYLYQHRFSGWVDDFSFDQNGDVQSEKINFVLKTIKNGKPAPLE